MTLIRHTMTLADGETAPALDAYRDTIGWNGFHNAYASGPALVAYFRALSDNDRGNGDWPTLDERDGVLYWTDNAGGEDETFTATGWRDVVGNPIYCIGFGFCWTDADADADADADDDAATIRTADIP